MMTSSKLCDLITNLRWSDPRFAQCTVESINYSKAAPLLHCHVKKKEEIKRFWLKVNDPSVFALYLSFNYENLKLKSIYVTAYLGEDSPSDFVHLKTITKGKDQVLNLLFEKITSERLKEKKRTSAQRNKKSKTSLKKVEAFMARV
jgi:hypothetical protein